MLLEQNWTLCQFVSTLGTRLDPVEIFVDFWNKTGLCGDLCALFGQDDAVEILVHLWDKTEPCGDLCV